MHMQVHFPSDPLYMTPLEQLLQKKTAEVSPASEQLAPVLE
jgi:hypothetical protein